MKTWQPQSRWSPWLWKVLPWINILATPDDHVLHPPDNLPITMLVNHCSVPKKQKEYKWVFNMLKIYNSNNTYVMGLPSMEPSVLPNHFISLGLVTPVAQHRRVPTGHKFALQYNYEFWLWDGSVYNKTNLDSCLHNVAIRVHDCNLWDTFDNRNSER